MIRTALLFTLISVSASLADSPRRLTSAEIVSPTNSTDQDDIVAKFNSEWGARRFAAIVKLSDKYPVSFIKLIRTYDLARELNLTTNQSERLEELESLDIGHMYDLRDIYDGDETEFQTFIADLENRHKRYHEHVNREVATILEPHQLKRLCQLRNHYHFFVYPDAAKALHAYKPKTGEFRIASAVQQRLTRNPRTHERVRTLLSRHFDSKEVSRILGTPSILENGARYRRL